MKKLITVCSLILIFAFAVGIICFATAEAEDELTETPPAEELTSATETTVTMSNIFADGMVIQAGKPINVFGYCETEGATVKVTLGENTAEATVAEGKWLATLPSMQYAQGLTLTVSEQGLAEEKPLTFEGVDIGEVWIIAGQSNATYEFAKLEDREELIKNNSNFENVKLFTETKSYYPIEQNYKYGEGKWVEITEDLLSTTVADYNISGLGYVMATRMSAEFGNDVTVALINVPVSGSTVKAWVKPELMRTINYDEYIKWQQIVALFPEYEANNNAKGWATDNRPYAKNGCVLYNTEIAPYYGYSAAGVIWWQGEGNAGMSETEYTSYFNGVRESIREAFSDAELPFFVMQLHPYGTTYANVCNMRYIQYNLAANEENTYVVSTAYEGMTFCAEEFSNNDSNGGYAHNARKSPIGLRLADTVLRKVYGFYEDTVGAPEIISAELGQSSITLTFNGDIYLMYRVEVEGFEIAASTGGFVKAKAVIDGNKVILSSDEVASPTRVRYAYGDLQVELKDGTVLSYGSSFVEELASSKGVVLTQDGASYRLRSEGYDSARIRLKGNLTNESGIPMAAFSLNLG